MLNGQTVSGFVITYNEQDNIRDCLETVKWVDELVVVDSFSDDATVDIARQYTQRVISHEFEGYTLQTRYAFAQCTGDWVLWLDTDERLTPEARAELQEALAEAGQQCDGFAFPRKTYFLDRWITHTGWYPQRRLRFFRRSAARVVGPAAHPRVEVAGPVMDLDGDILHYSYPGGLVDMVNRSARFAQIAARERYGQGRRFSLLSLLAKPPLEFLKKYVLLGGFLDGAPGFFIAVTSAYYKFNREAVLWELEHARQPETPERTDD